MEDNPGRLLAVDLGTKRVGLALSDPLKIIASPFRTLIVKSEAQLVDEVARIAAEKNVEAVVIGLPLKEDGSEGAGCQRSRRFEELLRQHGIKTYLWDESYTSRRAESLLREGGLNRKKAPATVDMVAASYILADYMQQRL